MAHIPAGEIIAALHQHSQTIHFLVGVILALDARQKNLEINLSRTIGTLERGWTGAAESLTSRDAALAQFEAKLGVDMAEIRREAETQTHAEALAERITDNVLASIISANEAVEHMRSDLHRVIRALERAGIHVERPRLDLILDERTAGEGMN